MLLVMALDVEERHRFIVPSYAFVTEQFDTHHYGLTYRALVPHATPASETKDSDSSRAL